MYTTANTVYIAQAGIKIIAGKRKSFFFFNLWKMQAHISSLVLLKCHKFEFVSYFKDDY
jgi:hypothetical protein